MQRVKFAREREEVESRTDSPLPSSEAESVTQTQPEPAQELSEPQAPSEEESSIASER